MAGQSRVLTKSFTAGAQVAPRRIVKFGAADDTVVPGAASTDSLVGVSAEIQAEIGEIVDVVLEGETDVTFGGAVTRGAFVTCDASGRAVTAAPGAGVNASVIGRAMCTATAAGDIGPVFLSPSMMQG